jgi:hypothetical protein
MGIECGVVADRHVKRSGFVPEGSKEGEEVNAMLCGWLPSANCASFNETIGGSCKINNNGDKNLVLQVEKDLGCKNIMCQKRAFWFVRKGGFKGFEARPSQAAPVFLVLSLSHHHP